MKKQTMALLLTLVMLLSVTPVFAVDEAPFTAKASDTELAEIAVTEKGYTPLAWNGTEMAATDAVTLYTVTLPEGTTEVALTFTENRLAYNYADNERYLAGEYEDEFTGADTKTVAPDADGDGYADYIQVQTPYDENWNTTTLYAIVFSMEGLKAPLPFAGVSGMWYRDAALSAVEQGWMDAVDGRFAGEADATRGVVIDALWRMAGKSEAKTSTGYADVDAENPYHSAIDWAVEQGIVTGYGDGRIGADDVVTREQLATLLYRYAQTQGKGFTGTWMLLLDVKDREAISEWAYESACWLYMNHVMTGRDGSFEPQSKATRAELATTLMKFAAVE